ncbi:MAG: uracil-DNA glycosylase [Ardenticatenaceae bacterium]|nr:uracil-DNA glycosylase [Ardenticatenaceae bacterium]MCB9446692.1 uracil-DNA glycosylase [Ardenticatenaceae bacterium]
MQFGLFEDKPNYYASLDDLINVMMNLTDDPLFPAGTNMVICRGNPKAKLMIIGEAPGPRENELGKPFVGRSGQLLDQILEAVKLDPDKDVFISNSVFRMPPGDGGQNFRKPTTEEIEYYKPYLLEIIRLVDPAIMLLTGNVATQSILGQTGITKLRGQWFDWNGRHAMPIFHPSYLLRNPSRNPGSPKALMWKDIQEVRRKLDELTIGN